MIEIPAYKDELRNTWYASFYYTDWQGKRRLKKKRGFQRKKDAQAFEEEFLRTRARSCDMTFRSFAEIYLGDMEPRLKRTTMQNKRYLIEHRVLPFFGDLPLNEITPAHVRKWQSQLLADKVAPTYAKTINIEALTMVDMANKQIIPAVMKYSKSLADAVIAITEAGGDTYVPTRMLQQITQKLTEMEKASEALLEVEKKASAMERGKEQAFCYHDEVMVAMNALRKPADELEKLVDKKYWPFPTYADLLFEV